MANSSLIAKDFIVVSTFKALVTKEVNGGIFNSRDGLLSFNVLKAVGLVPASGEDVEGDLSSNGVAISLYQIYVENKLIHGSQVLRESIVREFLLQSLDQGLADVVLLVIPISNILVNSTKPSHLPKGGYTSQTHFSLLHWHFVQ